MQSIQCSSLDHHSTMQQQMKTLRARTTSRPFAAHGAISARPLGICCPTVRPCAPPAWSEPLSRVRMKTEGVKGLAKAVEGSSAPSVAASVTGRALRWEVGLRRPPRGGGEGRGTFPEGRKEGGRRTVNSGPALWEGRFAGGGEEAALPAAPCSSLKSPSIALLCPPLTATRLEGGSCTPAAPCDQITPCDGMKPAYMSHRWLSAPHSSPASFLSPPHRTVPPAPPVKPLAHFSRLTGLPTQRFRVTIR
jgi:hypothetical protein